MELNIRLVQNISFGGFKYLFYRPLDSASRDGRTDAYPSPPPPLHVGYAILS